MPRGVYERKPAAAGSGKRGAAGRAVANANKRKPPVRAGELRVGALWPAVPDEPAATSQSAASESSQSAKLVIVADAANWHGTNEERVELVVRELLAALRRCGFSESEAWLTVTSTEKTQLAERPS